MGVKPRDTDNEADPVDVQPLPTRDPIMNAWFQGWRQKIGLVTLGLALVFLAVWLRSYRYVDVIKLPPGKRALHE